MSLTFIIGGARSGKSTLAQDMALKAGGDVLFVATAEPGDDEMRARIDAHKRSRPANWKTLEAPAGLGKRIDAEIGEAKTVVIDCITLLVSNVFQANGWKADAVLQEQAVDREIEAIIRCIDSHRARFIIVSNEIGLGIVPADPISRIYRDVLGRANRLLAARAEEVLLLVAGIPMAVKQP